MQELEVGVWVQCLRLRDRVLLSEFRVKGSGLGCRAELRYSARRSNREFVEGM